MAVNPIQVAGVGSIFIDDIVLPDGTTHMEQLGGGVVHALMGMALWGECPGLVAVAGYDPSETIRNRLDRHVDIQGLHFLDIPQIRAWQIFEEDGTRRELYRVKITEPFISGAQPHHLPDAYRASRAYYLLQDFEGIQTWSQTVKGMILWEPLQQVMQSGNRDHLRHCLQTCAIDIISPNLAEAQAIYGLKSADELVTVLLEDGAPVVALRLGAGGVLVASRSQRLHMPAVPVQHLVDPTGAGNTFCGAFLVGCLRKVGLRKAAAMATVAASFCVEQIGVLDPETITTSERDERCQELLRNN